MGAVETTERRRPWEERNPIISGVLAYLIPGAGHAYQGRWFKACIYFFGILGTFFGGMQLGEGAVVYNVPSNQWGVSLNYLAQVCVGLPALPAIQQAKRANAPDNKPLSELSAPLSAPFEGQLIVTGPAHDQPPGKLVGRVELETSREIGFGETRGKFIGTLDGQPVELDLSGGFLLERPISAGFGRKLECLVARQSDQQPHTSRLIRGAIPRKFTDAYAAPPDAEKLQDLHGRLGKFYDLAIALTMIAGLLNVLAVWDAVDGPAYGFGDEPPPSDAGQNPPPATAAAPATKSAPERPAGATSPSIR
jgi:hypothetical protein